MDILTMSETKLGKSFSKAQFLIKGFIEPYRLDRNSRGGRIMLFNRADISSKLLPIEKNSFEACYVGVNRLKIKWLLCCSHNPNQNNIHVHPTYLGVWLCINQVMKIILSGSDFNVGPDNIHKGSYDNFDMTNIIKEPTCFKNSENPSCFNLILTNRPEAFKVLVLLRQVFPIFIRWHSL